MKALITGGTGFIGSHLVECLIKKGFEVTCLVRDKNNLKNLQGINPIRILQADCLNPTDLLKLDDNYDYIFHLAGLTKAPTKNDFFLANVRVTENLISAVLNKSLSLKRFVHISSLSAVGPAQSNVPLTEESKPNPVSDYGISKLKGEELVYGVRDLIPITILRPTIVYGPRDKDFLVFFKLINYKLALYWGNCLYTFIYIDDLINGIIQSALHERAKGEIFFLTDGNIYSNQQVTQAIAKALDKKPYTVRLPSTFMNTIAYVLEKAGNTGIVNPDKIKELKQEKWICYNTKAVKVFGFKPHVDIMEGAQWTANWYKNQKWL
ncbi:MAG: NAD(P)-dependent oxidoreductase [Thermodesulfovibrionales bacterium]|nr:NAD(P)-dependent oxidoreductase [Thermodesulfovibrionales bacterium]